MSMKQEDRQTHLERNVAPRSIERDRSVVHAFLATPAAVDRFRKALLYAESVVHERAEELEAREGTSRRAERAREHDEWLQWGLSRIAYAREEPR
jgi:hypothetical protein